MRSFSGHYGVLRLSAARYHEWNKRPQDCSLDDRASCPRTSPIQVTAKEISDLKDMVVSQEYRHMSIRSRVLLAQRMGKLLFRHRRGGASFANVYGFGHVTASTRPTPKRVFARA